MKNNEMRLARKDLGPGVIDVGYGEPLIVLSKLLSFTKFSMNIKADSLKDCVYQPPQGNKLLIDLLEEKYNAKVVITNGAKQGIAAVCFALHQLGHKSMMIHSPYWVSTPTIIKDSGLSVELQGTENPKATAFMLTSPNNPDGKELSNKQIEELVTSAKENGIKLIHDAAYYTPIYVKDPTNLPAIGDVQIYSVSKMYGLSGLRVGYVVVKDESLLPGIVEFIERTCSGVSMASQGVLLKLESYFKNVPYRRELFESEARVAIAKSRKELDNLDPEVITIEPCESNSMFAWGKAGPKLDYVKAKVNVMQGDIFGKPGYIRINLAIDHNIMKEAVRRLNTDIASTTVDILKT